MKKNADDIISTAKSFGIDAQVIGRVEAAERNELLLELHGKKITY